MEPKTVQTAFEQPCQISNEYHSEDIEDVDDPSIIETWQKKRRSTSTYHLTTNKPLRNSKLFKKQTCSAGFENADKPTVDEPPENEEKYITIDKGLPSENEQSTRKEIGSVGEVNNRKFRTGDLPLEHWYTVHKKVNDVGDAFFLLWDIGVDSQILTRQPELIVCPFDVRGGRRRYYQNSEVGTSYRLLRSWCDQYNVSGESAIRKSQESQITRHFPDGNLTIEKTTPDTHYSNKSSLNSL
ncbi:hypothetical protein J6590_103243 [Homalodisca vitripennis]|nr:hypothetical protein J6590_103243 [Homalodisca vitripennis]